LLWPLHLREIVIGSAIWVIAVDIDCVLGFQANSFSLTLIRESITANNARVKKIENTTLKILPETLHKMQPAPLLVRSTSGGEKSAG
jgi:hypothetical protein